MMLLEMCKMKKENKKTNQAITIRIDKNTIEKFNETLTKIYGKNQRKKSTTIEQLLNQFNNQDTSKLKEYIDNNIEIINLSNEKIQAKEWRIETLEQTIQEKDNTITTIKNAQKQMEQSIAEKYADEIQTLEKQIQEKDMIIQDTKSHNNNIQESLTNAHNQEIQTLEKQYKKQIQLLEQTIQEKEKIIQDKDNTIATQLESITILNEDVKQLNKDVKTARSDYKHSTETLNKLHNDYNTIQNENKKYAIAIAEIKKMSTIERLFNRMPNSVNALPGADEQKEK